MVAIVLRSRYMYTIGIKETTLWLLPIHRSWNFCTVVFFPSSFSKVSTNAHTTNEKVKNTKAHTIIRLSHYRCLHLMVVVMAGCKTPLENIFLVRASRQNVEHDTWNRTLTEIVRFKFIALIKSLSEWKMQKCHIPIDIISKWFKYLKKNQQQ